MSNMRIPLQWTYFILIFLFFQFGRPMNPVKTKPNILFLFTDDQTYEAVHALGNEVVETPNMDRLIQSGTLFTHAYNMGGWNGAICTASRAMIISGRSIWDANEFRQRWISGDSAALEMTWGRMMHRAGYDTYMTGKWHCDAPADRVFDIARHVRPGMPPDQWPHKEKDQLPPGYNRPLSPRDSSWLPTDTTRGGYWSGGKHWSEVVRDDVLDYLQMANQSDRPFFIYAAFNAPHDPRQSPQAYLDRYQVDEIPLPPNFLPEYPDKEKIGAGRDLRDEALAPFPRTAYAIQKHRQEYYALITHLDDQIGQILAKLDNLGMKENTYVFLTADHGLAIGSHGLLGKQSLYDHSIRVPLAMTGPDVPEAYQVDADVYLQDVMATALQIAGVEKPGFVTFKSLWEVLEKKPGSNLEKGVYGAYMNLQRMIRKDGYKLIVYPEVPRILLYDLKADPHEINNLSDSDVYRDRIGNLWHDLKQVQADMHDSLALPDSPEGWLIQK